MTVSASHARAGRRRRLPVAAVVAVGLAAGALLGLGLALVARDDGGLSAPSVVLENRPISPDQPAVARRFVDAYARSISATYVALYDVRREPASGAAVDFARTIVQRLPARVVADQGAGTDRASVTADALASEQAAISSYFTGADPLYRIEADGDCFAMTLYRAMVDAPMGTTARWCFDAATGAVREREMAFADYAERETLRSATATVTDADVATPPASR